MGAVRVYCVFDPSIAVVAFGADLSHTLRDKAGSSRGAYAAVVRLTAVRDRQSWLLSRYQRRIRPMSK